MIKFDIRGQRFWFPSFSIDTHSTEMGEIPDLWLNCI